MKRIITYFSIVAALAFAASCTVESPVIPEESDGVITLQLQASALETRADGDADFENVVTHADFFFFSDEAGTTLLDGGHVRLDVAANGLVKNGNLYEYKFDATADGNPALKGPSYVYVIANYPEEISATTLEDILALDVKTDLSGEISYFVMDSYNSSTEKYMTYLSPSKAGDSKTYKIGLTRTAAKLVLKFNIIDSYEDEFGNVWTPGTSSMWVNFVNARKNAIVEAAPVEFTEKADYFTTAQVSPTSITSAKPGYTSWTTEAVYTYPQAFTSSDNKAPYFKLYCPWMCPAKGTSNFYYKIIIPTLDTFKRNKIYTLTVDVSTIGGTEDDWALVADYIYVADWFAPKAVEAEFESALYLDVAVREYTIYGIDDISVPVVSSNDIEIVSCTGSQQTVQGDTKTPRAVTLNSKPETGNYCVASGSDSFDLHYELDPNISTSTNPSFDCTPIEWTIVIRHKASTTEPYLRDKQVTVKITQYPSIYAELIEGGDSFINGYYSVQTASVYNNPNSEETWTSGGKTYYRWHSNANNNGDLWTSPNNTESGSYGRLNQSVGADKGSTMTIVTVTAFAPSSSKYKVWSNGSTTGNPNSSNKTEFEYIIGDPRVPWNELFEEGQRDLNPYLWGGTGSGTQRDPYVAHTEDWENVDKIMVAGKEKNVIAPAYMFNSDRGGRPGNNGVVYESAAKRCATYQEAGYPAGRWRLPTEAELYFAYCLQHMGVIPHLFNGGVGYHASSGNIFDWEGNNAVPQPANGNSEAFMAPGNYVHSIRCVYDIWYWGEEPAATGDDVHRYWPGTVPSTN